MAFRTVNARFGEAVLHLYPEASPLGDFSLMLDPKGNVVLTQWSLTATPPTDDEITAALAALDNAAKNADILAQITALEATQQRPMRELALGDESAAVRVRNIDDHIGVLRRQITAP